MVDPTTINKLLPQPIPGSDVGTWTDAYNSVFNIADASFGGMASVVIASTSVTLTSSQYACVFLQFTGALTGNTTVTLPAVGSFYTAINDTTNSSAFTITLQTTAAGSRVVGLPVGDTDIMTDGSNVRFRSLPNVGTYWQFSGSSTPAWVSACTIPPWLYCNGTSFSSATYPSLTAILGGTALPDLRGRQIAYLNDGTGRITTATGGIDGNTRLSAGGAQVITLARVNLPNVNLSVSDPGHAHSVATSNATTGTTGTGGGPAQGGYINGATLTVDTIGTGISVASGGSTTTFATLSPGAVGGITLIRAG